VRVAIGNLNGFGEPQTITEDSNAFDTSLELATDGQGSAAVVFTRQVGISPADVGYALRSPGQPFGESETIDGNAGNSFGPQVAFAPGGRAMAVWDNQDTSHRIRYAIREPGGQKFGSAAEIPPDPGDTAGGSQVALDSQGNALAVWTSADAGTFKVSWASAPPGQGFGSPGTLPGPDQGADGPEVAFDPQGNAVAAWEGYGATFSSNIETPVLAAGYDAAGPLLRSLSLPTAGTTARPVPFSVSPVDVWSPIASTRFTFGDGQATSAQPVPAPHTYRKAGLFQVSVTSTDALGNSSSAGGSVKIRDRTKPRISRLRMTRRTFAVGPRPTARSAAKKGSAFRYSISERARVTIQIARRAPGRRVGRRCRPPSPRLRHRKSCARYVSVGTLRRHARPAGAKATVFSGRIGKKALPPGRYRATLRAVDAAGNRSAPRRITFRIVSS
jgi:hypothetical protein